MEPSSTARPPASGRRPFTVYRLAAVGAVIAAGAAIATPALGLQQRVTHIFGDADGSPATAVDTANAERLLSVTDTRGGAVELWRAPNQSGGQCVYLRRPAAPADPTHLASGGGVCSVGPEAPQPVPIRTFLSWRSETGRISLLLGGHVASDSAITRIEVVANGTASQLPLKDGYFLTALPDAPAVGTLPNGAPYQVVGYDATGSQVASTDLAQQLARSQP